MDQQLFNLGTSEIKVRILIRTMSVASHMKGKWAIFLQVYNGSLGTGNRFTNKISSLLCLCDIIYSWWTTTVEPILMMVLDKNLTWSSATSLLSCRILVRGDVEGKMEYEGVDVLKWLRVMFLGGWRMDFRWLWSFLQTQPYCTYSNLSIFHSWFVVRDGKHLARFLKSVLNFVVVVTEEIKRGSTK